MKYCTEIWAVDPRNIPENTDQAFSLQIGPPVKWAGPIIDARSRQEAEEILQINGIGYARVTGKFVENVDFNTGRRVPLHESPWIYHD